MWVEVFFIFVMKNYFRIFVRNLCCAIFLGAFALTVFADNQSFENNIEKKSNGDIIIKGIPEDCGGGVNDKPLVFWGFLSYYKCDLTKEELKEKLNQYIKRHKGYFYYAFPRANEYLELPYSVITINNPDFNETKDPLDEGRLLMARFKDGNTDWNFILERTAAREKYKNKISEWKSVLKKNAINDKIKQGDVLFGYLYGYNKNTKEILFYVNQKYYALTFKELKEHITTIYYMDGKTKKTKKGESGKRKLKL